MKKITLLSLLIGGMFLSNAQEKAKKNLNDISPRNFAPSGVVRCATDEYEAILQANDSKRMNYDQFNAYIAPFVDQYLNNPENASQSGGIIYIPVVVHVIHNGDAYGVDENIADEQVESQITVMTQDFRRMAGTPGFNSNPIGADVQVEFVLAKVDPNGNPTNGINRVNLCEDNYNKGSFGAIQSFIDTNVKPQTIWDPTQYMNMWSVNWDGSGLLGYAQFPSTGTATANTDGVVAGHSYFGSRTIYPAGTYGDFTYDKGRTMTHEVGHFLGLYHTFQGGCAAPGDNVSDTPAVATANYGCPTGTDSCTGGGVDMIENYMDYTDDSCMNIFTAGQKAVVVSVMNSFPRRSSLKLSQKDIAIPLFANDAEVQIENYCSAAGGSGCNASNPAHKVLLYNRGTSNLTSATLSYNVNGGTAQTYNWTGNLAPNKYAEVSLNTVETTGTFNVSVTATNGGADQRATNNTASKAFTFPSVTGPTDYPFTTFHMTLITDNYGYETSWELTNAAGTVLYSGGVSPTYANASTVYDADWTLPAGGCYTFTIYDAYGDGICCSYGNGSYTITTNSGATTVATGGNFSDDESVSFTNASLNNAAFAIESISLFPNPTKDILNIAVPTSLGNDISYEVYNNLGQVVKMNTSNNNEFGVSTSDLANGVYFIKVSVDNASKVLRFIKN